ncbi:protein GPR107 [Elysia marginata]|uniref:Protein GPR107 n=1 Tax=Elysia marginata TaxID=1093978 RepID=A0AAV4JAD9_9GAST|nr:protein GPR107 [Elysia marginata]
MENSPTCVLDQPDENETSVFFRFDLKTMKLIVERHGTDLHDLVITDTRREQYLYQNGLEHGVAPIEKAPAPVAVSDTKPVGVNGNNGNTSSQHLSQGAEVGATGPNPASPDKSASPQRRKREAVEEKPDSAKKNSQDKALKPSQAQLPAASKKSSVIYLPMTRDTDGSVSVYSTYFLVHFRTTKEEGLYNLFFHNCLKQKSLVNLSLHIVQDNNGNYLSADEMPIPALYFMFSVVFFILTAVWFSVLRKAEEGVFKIHYMMLVVVVFKAFSCLFHGVNMHMIQQTGIHVDAWAILWYIVYLMRGALMFVTVLLIGAGWAFIKHVFTDREKKLFLVIIPMQILMNVAWVIVEESEQGDASYNTWNKIFIGVDLLCCFAILFPVVWSIRHLQEASKTDGKAAINLNKLKLFRHFYILVVAYIYFTRIIGYLLKITLPFRYGWMTDLFHEIFLLIFFVSTGYKFRPTMDNPYLQVPLDSDDEEEIEMDEVMTKTGNMDTVVRVNQGRNESTAKTVVKQRESSHEYD